MDFPHPLLSGRLIRRYKRFLADVVLCDGTAAVAHCPNPGSMLGLAEPGLEVWVSPARNPARKLKYSWEIVAAAGALVGINTSLPNAIVAEAIAARGIPELSGYASLRREVRYGADSRVDLLLEDPARPPCYVEVKSVTLKRGRRAAAFPDAISTRAAKHARALAGVARAGGRAVVLFLAQRGDCDELEIAADIDPVYDQALGRAMSQGVEVLCYGCRVRTTAIAVERPLRFRAPARAAE